MNRRIVGAGLLVVLVLGSCQREPEGRPHVLIWLVDTLRADHLGCYGYERATSPTMDALADDGVLFEQCHVHSNWTQPSVASLFSGCYPPQFSRDFTSRVPEEMDMAAEWLSGQGYDTAAFTVTVATAARFGFHQGFRVYEELDYRLDMRARKHRRGSGFDADRLVDAATLWLDNSWRQDQPFLLSLHSVDPHLPYEPHGGLPSFAGAYDGPIDGGTTTMSRALADGYEFTPADRAHLIDMYDDEVRYNDACLARMLEALEERDLLDDTLLVIVSDHGEEFFERTTFGHGKQNLHAELTRVPLILHWPAGLPGGTRVAGLMRGIDVLPTVLDVMGLPPLPAADGTSVANVITGTRDLSGRRTVVLADRAKSELPSAAAARTDELLFHRRTSGELDAVPVQAELFDVTADAAERIDIAERRPGDALRLQEVMRSWHELLREREQAWRVTRGTVEVDAAAQEALQALGYLDDG